MCNFDVRRSVFVTATARSTIFTARLRMRTHGLAIEICPSVCLSVKRVHCDKTKQTPTHIFTESSQMAKVPNGVKHCRKFQSPE